MSNSQLLASSGSLDGIRRIIANYYGGATITLDPVGEHWDVFNAHGHVKAVIVRRQGFRFRFERLMEVEVLD